MSGIPTIGTLGILRIRGVSHYAAARSGPGLPYRRGTAGATPLRRRRAPYCLFWPRRDRAGQPTYRGRLLLGPPTSNGASWTVSSGISTPAARNASNTRSRSSNRFATWFRSSSIQTRSSTFTL